MKPFLPVFGFGLLSFFVSSWASPVDPLERHYKIEADFRDLSRVTFPVYVEITVQNNSQKPLQELWVMLYPNRFQTSLPNLNDLNFFLFYPKKISLGGLTPQPSPWKWEPISTPFLPSNTLFRLVLSSPLQPQQKIVLPIRYQLRIPEKFGTFGKYRKTLTLSGGWYPYVISYKENEGFQPNDLPPLASWEVLIRTDSDTFVSNTQYSRFSDPIQFRSSQQREISVFIKDRFHWVQMGGRWVQVQLVFLSSKEKEAQKGIQELVARWLEFVDSRPFLFRKRSSLVFIQSHLRDSLVGKGEGHTYFSDRAFKVFSGLEQYHTVPILQSLFYQLAVQETSTRETSKDYDWVAEALAWHWTEQFLQELSYQHRDARTLGPIRWLSFMLTIDRVIYAPQFSFYDVFYDSLYPDDPVRDDPLRFNHRRLFGRSMFAQLEDTVGVEATRKICDAYFQNTQENLLSLSKKISGKNLEPQFNQWTSPRPRVNYVLQSHSEKKEGKRYQQNVHVYKKSSQPLQEPVELGVKSKKQPFQILKWDGEGKEHTYSFVTETPVQVLQLDPRGRLLETSVGDNRKPPRYKWVLTEFFWDYDFNENQPSFYASSQFRKAYGGLNRWNLSGSYGLETYGIGIGYTRLFGRLLDRLRLSHGLSLGFNFSHLDQDFSFTSELPQGENQWVLVGDKANATSFSLSYFSGNQLSLTNPLEGGGASISCTVGSSALGGDHSYYKFSFGASWVFPLQPSHLLAFRSFLGVSGPSEIPSQLQYHLGGIGSLRGLSLEDDKNKGRNIFLVSAEYRHFLWTDLDWNLGLFRLRNIQGAFFTDAGQTTDTLEEKANRQILGSGAQRTTAKDLFDLSSFSSDIGYGLRFHIDYLGVNPGLLAIDVAKELTDLGSMFRFYFGVTQSF